jgi:hypothetical protein
MVKRLALAVAIAAVSGLAACEKTGENEFQVQTPDVDVSADTTTVRTPDVDIVKDTVTVPKVRVKRP